MTSKPPREASFFFPSKEAKLLWTRVLLRLNELVSLELGIGGRDTADATLSDNTVDDTSSSPPERKPCFKTSGAQDCCEPSPLFRFVPSFKKTIITLHKSSLTFAVNASPWIVASTCHKRLRSINCITNFFHCKLGKK